MTAPDLHPDELLDRAARGEALSTQEQSHLDAHLVACPACRFERQARADFAALPDLPLDVDAVVTRALAGLPSQAPAPQRRRRPSAAFIAVAASLAAAVSFGAIGLARPLAVLLGLVAPPPPAVVPAPSHEPAPPPERATPPPRASDEPSIQPEPAAPPAPPTPPRVTAVRPPSPPPPPPAPAPKPSASELFREATAARVDGRRDEAERLYRELTREHPESTEAITAHAVLGKLLLDVGRPAEALPELEASLSEPDAGLREDALAAKAAALEALGNRQKARAAWRQLLDEFPSSIHARRARERLEDFGE